MLIRLIRVFRIGYLARLIQVAPARNALHLSKSTGHPAVHVVGTGDVDLVVLVDVGQTNSATTLDLSLPISGDRPYCGVMDGGAM